MQALISLGPVGTTWQRHIQDSDVLSTLVVESQYIVVSDRIEMKSVLFPLS